MKLRIGTKDKNTGAVVLSLCTYTNLDTARRTARALGTKNKAWHDVYKRVDGRWIVVPVTD